MKKLLFLVLLLSNFFGYAQYTAIPDANFERNLIYLGIDSGAIDGKVLTANISGVTSLDVSYQSITDLIGLQDFIALIDLNCSGNNLTSLNISKNIALKKLNCMNTKITNLDFTKNTALTYLNCSLSKLTNLDVTKNMSLTYLDCSDNQLTDLDVSKNSALTYLNCYSNKLIKLDISENRILTSLNCGYNKLTSLDFSKNISIVGVDCQWNQITSLDFSKNTKLEGLYCINNLLDKLNLKNGQNTTLTHLIVGYNPKLSCIQVDSKSFADATWQIGIPYNASFYEKCSTVPTITSITPASRCNTGIVTLEAIASDGIISWYDVPTGGTSLGTGTLFTTPIITATTKYYVDATDGNYTTPTRTEIIATVNNTIPTITSITSASRCDTGTLSLGAIASDGIINWYDVSTGGTSLGIGTTFTTPNITSTTKYYVDASNTCTTPTRTEIIATVNTTPTITSITSASRCDTGTVTLGAIATDGIINWYDVPTGGTSLGTGTSFTTPNITSNTKYYVDASTTDCTTPTRTEIIATVNTTPIITSTIPISRCGTGIVTLEASASGGIINWYDVPNGGTSLGTGTSFTTPNITSTTKYYVDASTNDCKTPTRTEIIATVNTTPTITSTTPASRCDTGTVTLEATASNGIINWYDVPTGGTSLSTGTIFTTPSINTSTTFYVDATDNICPSPRRAIVATVFPVAKNIEEVILCESEIVTLDASISGMDYVWSPGGETTQTIVVSSPGNYSVITSSSTVICNSKKDIKVIEHKNAIIKNIIVDENTITIALNNPENYYEFSIDGKFFQNSNQFSHIPSGQYTAFARAKYLCDIVQQDFTIFTIAKYFTPNNDGYNDVWEIKEMKNYPKSSALIFDRYGKLIKYLISSSPFWDGTYNNTPLPADDYWYSLKLDESKPELKGHFSLKR